MVLLGPLVRISHDCNQGVGWAVFSSRGLTEEEPTFMLPQVVGRVHFLGPVVLIMTCFFKVSKNKTIK